MSPLEPGLHVVSMNTGKRIRSVTDDGVLVRLLAVLATDDGDEPIAIDLTVNDGTLEVREIHSRQLRVIPKSSNLVVVEAERRLT